MVQRSLHELLKQVLPVRRPGRGGCRTGSAPGRKGAARRLAVEQLEDRTVLSTLATVPVFSANLPASASSGGVAQPDVSADGRYVVYTATAPSLVPGQADEAPIANIFLYDTLTQTTTLVSHVPGQPTTGADGPSGFAAISGDDRSIVYSSQATDLVPGQTGLQTGVRGRANVFLYDLSTGTTTLVSHAAGAPSVTGNDDSTTQVTTGFGFNQNGGRFLLFVSRATDLVAGQDRASHFNLFVYDTQAQTTTLVSHVPGDPATGGNDDTFAADISQDGGIIAYINLATDLVPNQQGQADNVFFYDNRPLVSGAPNPNYGKNFLVSGAFDPATGGPSPTTGAGFASAVAVSADGTFVTYVSSATNLVASQSTDVDPTTGFPFFPTPNAFGLSLHTGKTYLLSGAATASGPSPSVTSNGVVTRLAVSSDGSSVAFISDASDLDPSQSGSPGQDRNSGNAFVDQLSPADPSQQTRALASYDADAFRQTGTVEPAGGVVIRNKPNFTDLTMSLDGRFITYQQQQTAGVTGPLVPGQNGPDLVSNSFVYDQQSRTNALLSRVNGTAATTGNFNSTASRVSGNGRAVAFESQATNLNPGNLNGAPVAQNGANLFVYPTLGSGPALLSSQTAVQVNAQTYVYGTSGDGRYVVFTSNSPTVVPGQVDANADQDVFVYDRQSGTTALVSHVPGSPPTAGNAGSPDTIDGTQPVGAPVVISQDGSWIAFVSDATNLVAGQTGLSQTVNLYLFDNRPGPTFGTVTLITSDPLLGESGDNDSFNPVISADGSFIAFVSFATNLVPGAVTGPFVRGNVYLYSRATGGLSILSAQGSNGSPGDGDSGSPSISDDGRHVVFESRSTNLVSGATVGASNNIYLVDTSTGQTTLVSHAASSATTEADAESFDPVVSPDGSTVAFVSFATDLVPGQMATPYSNVFLYDVAGRVVRLVSGAGGSATQPGNGFSDSPALSANGGEVAFRSGAPDLVAGQIKTPGAAGNVFLFNRQAGTVTLVSHAAGSPTTTAAGNSEAPGVDGAGGLVVYVSTAPDLVPGQQGGGVNNVFLYSVTLGASALLSGQDGSPVMASSDPTYLAVVSRDPVVALNRLSGRGHTSVAFINKLISTHLVQATIPAAGPNTPVGRFVTETAFVGQYQPLIVYRLTGAGPNDGLFQISGSGLLTGPSGSIDPTTYPSVTIQVLTDIGLGPVDGLDTLTIPVGSAPPPPPPGGGVTARLVVQRVRKKALLMIEVFDAATGALEKEFASPFQKPAFKNIQVSVAGSDEVVVTARKRKRTVTATFPA